MDERDARILLAHKSFEKERALTQAKIALQNAISAGRLKVEQARKAYQESVAVTSKIPLSFLQFSDGDVCCGTKLILHCVYDLRTRWPCCIFCGHPRDGD